MVTKDSYQTMKNDQTFFHEIENIDIFNDFEQFLRTIFKDNVLPEDDEKAKVRYDYHRAKFLCRFWNLISFGLPPKESTKTEPFLQSSQKRNSRPLSITLGIK